MNENLSTIESTIENPTNPNLSFAELFQESMAETDFSPGALIKAKVVNITPDFVFVCAGLKSEARIPRREFASHTEDLEVAVGDEIEVILEAIENGAGETRVSREKARRITAWRELEEAFAEEKNVSGVIVDRVRGGFTVELNKVRAFLPGSLLDVKPIQDISFLEGKELDFKVIKVDRQHNNVVVSRRAVLLAEGDTERLALLETLHEGDIVTGVVKNLTDYGAFVDLGGADGLLHITDISWKRIRHPSEAINLGDKIQVKILKFDREKHRVSLGMKQLSDDPWADIHRRYPVGARVFGKVTNVTDYGCFVEIETGVEGLVHVSEMDWKNKNLHPNKVVSPGQEVEVMVLEIDADRRRISLGMKQCQSNPWQEFSESHAKGDKIIGKIKSITDFGLFVGLPGDIDGLIHLSDLSWTESGENLIGNYEKDQEVEAVILSIDAERERISLGIKQLEHDVYADFLVAHPKGSIVSGKVTEVNAQEAWVDLGDNIKARIRSQDVSRERVQDATQYLHADDEIEAKVMGLDKKNHVVQLSIKALQAKLTEENTPANTQLGDLLKEHINEGEDEGEASATEAEPEEPETEEETSVEAEPEQPETEEETTVEAGQEESENES